jgi:hypothetical protein
MIPKESQSLPLTDLIRMREELDELIKQRREEAANEARKALERTADELGISVRELINGTRTKRARKSSSKEASSNEQ